MSARTPRAPRNSNLRNVLAKPQLTPGKSGQITTAVRGFATGAQVPKYRGPLRTFRRMSTPRVSARFRTSPLTEAKPLREESRRPHHYGNTK